MRSDELFDVRGLATVVTGGASGLGLAYAEAMAENGARVTLMDIDVRALEHQVGRLREAGFDVRGECVDVTDRTHMAEAFDATAAHYGRLDVVFANAGIDLPPGFLTRSGQRAAEGAIDTLPEANWDQVIAINLTGVFLTIRAAARHMKPHNAGRIIVTTSAAAFRPSPVVGLAYMPAKAGAAHLVRQAALELARYGILVNAIAPGPFVTNIAGGHSHSTVTRAAVERRSPLHRMGHPDEIKGLALFLASPASSYMTGAQIVIDGGSSLGSAD
jgi:NAD(P)-dependent dehydrogenase (short-subunit alcohol dehydrogenase family)